MKAGGSAVNNRAKRTVCGSRDDRRQHHPWADRNDEADSVTSPGDLRSGDKQAILRLRTAHEQAPGQPAGLAARGRDDCRELNTVYDRRETMVVNLKGIDLCPT